MTIYHEVVINKEDTAKLFAFAAVHGTAAIGEIPVGATIVRAAEWTEYGGLVYAYTMPSDTTFTISAEVKPSA
jgi:hypothetical protein